MNLSSSFKHKLSVSRAHIDQNDIKEEEEEDGDVECNQVPKERRKSSIRKQRTRRLNSKSNLAKSAAKAETDEDETDNDDSPHLMNRPRVDRFLSIVEIPPEVIWLTQQKFANSMANKWNDNSIEEADENGQENETKIESVAKTTDTTVKPNKPKTKSQPANNKKHSIFNNSNLKFFGADGTGLTQATKALIIKDIIRNYDIGHFMNELRAKDVVQIKLNKKLF